jgi:hypothetical protein
MYRQQGQIQVNAPNLFSDPVSPGFDHFAFILAGPDMVVIDQLNLIQGDGAFAHCGSGL